MNNGTGEETRLCVGPCGLRKLLERDFAWAKSKKKHHGHRKKCRVCEKAAAVLEIDEKAEVADIMAMWDAEYGPR